jgi:hypothetical protein
MQQNRQGQSAVEMELVLSAMEEVSDLYTPAADTYLLFCHLPCATTASVCCSYGRKMQALTAVGWLTAASWLTAVR